VPAVSELAAEVLIALQLPGVGPAAVRKHLQQRVAALVAGEPLKIYTVLPQNFPDATLKVAGRSAEEILEKCDEADIWLVSVLDKEYPPRLREIPDYPPVIFVKGSAAALRSLSVAVVGTREASELGKAYASEIAELIAEEGLSVVSGLAFGIDTAAHLGALRAHGLTTAVLAHGLDRVYPAANSGLAEKILDSGGALVSEHRPGVPPYKPEFVRRNRIQSGMASASIMVESGWEGGSIHQARFAHSQGRPLFVVSPPRDSTAGTRFNYRGAHRIIEEFGARVIETQSDVAKLSYSLRMSGPGHE